MIQIYLLKVEELRQQMEKIISAAGEPEDAVTPGWDKLAPWQREKVSGCVRPGPKALSMGGQLLLQYGARLARENPGKKCQGGENVRWQQLTFPQLLAGISGPLPLGIAYGPKGKPYVRHVPWHYNLSHSGDYVALAISDAPVGIDIQQIRHYSDSLVKRFFSKEEAAACDNLFSANTLVQETPERQQDRRAFFYTLWCRKEAYGKLLGTGLTEAVLKRNMLEDADVHFDEYGELPGYGICVCSGNSGSFVQIPPNIHEEVRR